MLSNVPRLRRSLMYRGRAGNSVSINFRAAVPHPQLLPVNISISYTILIFLFLFNLIFPHSTDYSFGRSQQLKEIERNDVTPIIFLFNYVIIISRDEECYSYSHYSFRIRPSFRRIFAYKKYFTMLLRYYYACINYPKNFRCNIC